MSVTVKIGELECSLLNGQEVGKLMQEIGITSLPSFCAQFEVAPVNGEGNVYVVNYLAWESGDAAVVVTRYLMGTIDVEEKGHHYLVNASSWEMEMSETVREPGTGEWVTIKQAEYDLKTLAEWVEYRHIEEGNDSYEYWEKYDWDDLENFEYHGAEL